ncbi:hypothetical protein [Actinoplanes sp. CA-252034]|uniref:hypothetical protein n=1 Tax=Actinoplanes sp. CA-252034 TaxID=3239906 RepID=UPI003D97547F
MEESVITFGGGDEKPRRTIFRDLGRDRRLPVLVAGLSALSAFGSLISEWQTTTINVQEGDGEQPAEPRVLIANLLDLGGMGAGYLLGLIVLVVAVVLTLFGPGPGRAYTKVAGLAVGGVLVALLVSLAHHLGDASAVIPKFFTAYDFTGSEAVQTTYGRGVWCALAAVGLALVALWLPERAVRTAPEPPVLEHDDGLDMTITPATPFASSPGELDQPHRS